MKKISKIYIAVIVLFLCSLAITKLVVIQDTTRPYQVNSLTDSSRAELSSSLSRMLLDFYSSKTSQYAYARSLKEVKPELISELQVTNSIADIQKSFSEFRIIPLRTINKEKAVFSCGNGLTSFEKNQDERKKHEHADAITVDIAVFMNPTIIADLKDDGVYNYLQNQGCQFSEIFNECASERLLNKNSLANLRRILKPNGLYKLITGVIGITINKKSLENTELGDRWLDIKDLVERESCEKRYGLQDPEIPRSQKERIQLGFDILVEEDDIQGEQKQRLENGKLTIDDIYEILVVYFFKNGFLFERSFDNGGYNAFEVIIRHKNGKIFGVEFTKGLCIKRLD